MTKPVANPSAGAKSSGKFTFAVISPEKESQQVNLQNLKFQSVDLISFTHQPRGAQWLSGRVLTPTRGVAGSSGASTGGTALCP